MDATTFRLVLIVIAVIVALAIYLYGKHQSRLRKRSAIETFTREEVDSAFIEDEQLRFELNSLNQVLHDNEDEEILDEIHINPAEDSPQKPQAAPEPDIFVPAILRNKQADRLVSYHLRHDDFRLITGEEASSAVEHAGLELNDDSYLEYREEGDLAFRVASLSAPGDFAEIEQLDFTMLGFNCFIDLDDCENPGLAYETLLKKIDELVRMLNVKVYLPSQQLLTISDVTGMREKLS